MNPSELFTIYTEGTPASVRLATFTELRKAVLPVLNVRDYGVMGNAVTDDRPALQALIEATKATGGILYFPVGTYLVSVDPSQTYCLRMYGGISLVGEDRYRSIIKVANGQPNYNDIIGHVWTDPITHCVISNLGFDHNRANNPHTLAEILARNMRTIGFWTGHDITVKDCRFCSNDGLNFVMLSGDMWDLRVFNCLFEDICGGPVDHDFSAIYLKCRVQPGHGIWIEGNSFRPGSASRNGAWTAIETHGSYVSVRDNVIQDMRVGMIITGERTDMTCQVSIVDNHISRCNKGIELWSMFCPDLGFTVGPGMRACRVSGNQIDIDLDEWQAWHMYGTGIWVYDGNTAATYELMIDHNCIRYLPYIIAPVVAECNGIYAQNHQADLDQRWMIDHNIIVNCPGNGIHIHPVVTPLIVSDNVI